MKEKEDELIDINIMDHYKECMCLKPTTYGPRNPTRLQSEIVEGCKNAYFNQGSNYLCVLQKGHTGKCSHTFNILFDKHDKICKKVINNKLNLAIYSTPGNDDVVYKNRASRLFKNVLSSIEHLKIRDKSKKKKCAIPLRDASTPQDLARAYLDWTVIILNVREIKDDYVSNEYLNNLGLRNYISKHKEFMENFYKSHNRNIFDKDGNTICGVTDHLFKMEDLVDDKRDIRVSNRETDLQLGHVQPRSEDEVTIRALNLVPMTREGNRLVGDHVFTKNVWSERLLRIARSHINSN